MTKCKQEIHNFKVFFSIMCNTQDVMEKYTSKTTDLKPKAWNENQ